MLQSHGQLKNRVLFLGAKNFPPGARFDLCHKSGVDDDQLKLQLWPPVDVVAHIDQTKKLIKSANSIYILNCTFFSPKIVLDFLIDHEIEAFCKTIYDDHCCKN